MNREKKLLVILGFNLLLMLLEAAGGILSHSLALLSDAGHMFTDSLALFLSYTALNISKKPATEKKTYGYHRFEILASLANGIILLLVSVYIFYEAVNRFFHPVEIKIGLLLIIASIGFAGNLAGLLLLRHESHENLNMRGAFFHLLGDTLSSVGVIAGGIVLLITKWHGIDSLIGILIAGIILRGSITLIEESGEVLLEATPRDVDIRTLRNELEKIPGIKEFHDMHVWTITSGRRSLSGHLLADNITTRESQDILCKVRELLAEKFNITHSTIEVECDSCLNNTCEFVHRPKNGKI